MVLKTKAQIESEMQEFKDSGAKAYRWNDTVTIEGTGAYSEMPKGKKYMKVHKLTAATLVKKGYAAYVA